MRKKVHSNSGKEIGYIEKKGDMYETTCYLSDFSHIGAESEKEAIKDVLDEYEEQVEYILRQLKSNSYFRIADKSEIISFSVGKNNIKIEISAQE